MKKIISLFLFISLYSTCQSQITRGTVLDQNSGRPIGNAIVYLNGTFIGAYTDQNGVFEIKIPKNLMGPLTISSIGYYSVIKDIYPGKQLLVYLRPKVYQIQEVVISAKGSSKARKTNLKIFKREFLGSTMNAKKCEITNENDIMLKYNSGRDTMVFLSESIITSIDTLKAFTSNPIIIDNKALGYKLTYYLDKFEYSPFPEYLLIQGNCIFKEVTPDRDKLQNRYEIRRRSAYLGSRMHFFRALWYNDLDSAGFTVRDSINKILAYNKIISQSASILGSDHLKHFKYRGYMSIAYYSKIPHTYILVERDSVLFNKDGALDPLGISWHGEMARQRIGDLLPLEYEIK